MDKYGPAPVRVHKKVTWFLMDLERESERAPDPVETAEVRWFPLDEAIAAIEFKPEREVIEKARERLKHREPDSTSPTA